MRDKAPKIDGSILDLVVDYLTYVFVPAVLIYRAGLSAFAPAAVAAILLSSLYTFARTDMKTEDNFFRGFPAVWNVVAFYLFVVHPAPWVGAAAIGLFAVLTFAPIHVVHPVRVRRFQPWLRIATAVWTVGSLVLLIAPDSAARVPALTFSLGGLAIILAIGLLRTLRGEPGAEP